MVDPVASGIPAPGEEGRTSVAGTPGRTRWCPWLALGLLVAAASALRATLLDVPLERDEGEYAYFGQLLLQGIPPWERAYNMKLPGIYLAYAGVLALFGQTTTGIHAGLASVSALSAALLFLLVRRLIDPWTGVAAAAFLLLLELGEPVQGLFANAEHFVLPWALLGLWLIARAVHPDDDRRTDQARTRDRLLGGLALGMAFLTKQHGVFFVLAGGITVVLHAWRGSEGGWSPASRSRDELLRASRRILVQGAGYSVAALLPFALACAALAIAGVFPRFWFWTFTYARVYAAQSTLVEGWPKLVARMGDLAMVAPIVAGLAAVGLGALFLWPRVRRRLDVVLPFVLLSPLAVMPGFLFRPHYFVLLLPAMALLAGLGVRSLAEVIHRGMALRVAQRPLRWLGAAVAGLLVVAALAQSLDRQRIVLFELTPTEIARRHYGPNPFPESEAIAEWIRRDTRPEDTIVVLGSEPQIYFHARRLAATGYVYTYGPMEPHGYARAMQREMIHEISASAPAYAVWMNCTFSWMVRRHSPRLILRWARRYLAGLDFVARFEITRAGSRLRLAEEWSGGAPPVRLDPDPSRCVADLYRAPRPAEGSLP